MRQSGMLAADRRWNRLRFSIERQTEKAEDISGGEGGDEEEEAEKAAVWRVV